MIKQAERIESILHNAIEKVANVAIIIAKAIVTLVCLGASVSYSAGIKVREIFDARNAARPDANNNVCSDNVIETHVDVIEQSKEQSQVVDYAPNDTDLAREKIFDIIQSINLVKPIVKVNSIDNFIKTSLHDKLSENYLTMVSYKLPRNRRTKKTHIRHGNLGILKEHYPIIMATRTLR